MSKSLWGKYYQKGKERVQKETPERYQYLFEEEKNKKWKYGYKQYKNFPEHEKQKLVECRKK